MYSTNDERKSAVAERFNKTLKNKIDKHMTAVSKKIYFDVLNDIDGKYNNTFHRKIRMKLIDVNSYAEYKSDHVRILKYKNIFAVGYTPNQPAEVFVISKIEKAVPWTYVIHDLNGEEIVGTF